jgi:pimeloyl-ACP methyl ester carboxylesterase
MGARPCRRGVIGATIVAACVGAGIAAWCAQAPAGRGLEEEALREYAGVYRWGPDAFLYLQLWNELAGTNQLVAFDESGEVRTLYPIGRDRFVAGPGAAVSSPIQSQVAFQREPGGVVASLTWTREGVPPRVAERVEIERREDVRFSNGAVRLAGTLRTPATRGRHPAIILVHYSGPANRDSVLPFARFLLRRGIAVLGYDKRGVGASTGDWNVASFDDLAGDAVAAFEYLKTRHDIDAARIGLLGVSQAGWIMPLAAVRAKDVAFLISISGAGVSPAETVLDHARNEMTAAGMPAPAVGRVIDLMTVQHEFARTGRGWDRYAAQRTALASRMGGPPESFPGTPDHPRWQSIRRLHFYDPAPTLRRLRVPTLAIFGQRDNNIMPEKNAAAWKVSLEAGGHRDYELHVLDSANHFQLEAVRGTNAEIATLQRFVPGYRKTIEDWLIPRLGGAGRGQ